jgi:cellulose biosynthesis protein BcsQ
VTAEIITIASLKSGVGKTAAASVLASAAAAGGLDAVAVDLDPSGGVSSGVVRTGTSATIVDVLHGRATLASALSGHRLGYRTVPSHHTLGEDTLTERRLHAALDPIRGRCDVVILDTGIDEGWMLTAMCVADRVVIAVTLDILAMRAAALTAGLALEAGVLDRVSGLVVGNAFRPLSNNTEQLLDALLVTGIAFDTVLWHSEWSGPASDAAQLPEALLIGGKTLLREVASRPAPTEALHHFVGLAQGRHPLEVAVSAG